MNIFSSEIVLQISKIIDLTRVVTVGVVGAVVVVVVVLDIPGSQILKFQKSGSTHNHLT